MFITTSKSRCNLESRFKPKKLLCSDELVTVTFRVDEFYPLLNMVKFFHWEFMEEGSVLPPTIEEIEEIYRAFCAERAKGTVL